MALRAESMPGQQLQRFGRFALRGLRIGASTIAIVELLRSDWSGGLAASGAWLMFVQVERRLAAAEPNSDSPGSTLGQP